jgi:antitoxin component of MazEF toxin-antitoxin module
MRSSVARMGHQLVVVLPESYCEQAGLDEGSFIDLDVNGDRLTVRPVRYGVSDLIARLKNPQASESERPEEPTPEVHAAKVSTRKL